MDGVGGRILRRRCPAVAHVVVRIGMGGDLRQVRHAPLRHHSRRGADHDGLALLQVHVGRRKRQQEPSAVVRDRTHRPRPRGRLRMVPCGAGISGGDGDFPRGGLRRHGGRPRCLVPPRAHHPQVRAHGRPGRAFREEVHEEAQPGVQQEQATAPIRIKYRNLDRSA